MASATETVTPEIGSGHRPATTRGLACVVAVLGMMDRGNQALLAAVKQYGKAYNRFAEDPAFIRWDLDRQPVVPWAVQRDDSARGSASAPFVAITYSDFQCPHCRTLAEKLDEVQRKFPGRLRVVFRHFPLDRSCNPLTRTYLHAFSCQAARAAEAARRLGGDRAFWKMHDALFAHQAELDRQPYAQLAGQIGLDSARFISEMNSPRTWERVKAHIERSKPFDVSTTPAVFLNGRRVRVWRSTAFWEAVLAAPSSRPTSTAASAGATSRAAR
jgi:protein-disulfide isomerase